MDLRISVEKRSKKSGIFLKKGLTLLWEVPILVNARLRETPRGQRSEPRQINSLKAFRQK